MHASYEAHNGKTPLGKKLLLPTKQLAQSIEDEWNAQNTKINKEKMPLTRIASIAIDLAAVKRIEIYEDILPYGETDLICYRAGDIPELHAEQAKLLDPLIQWSGQKLGVKLVTTEGLIPVLQPETNKDKLQKILDSYDDWKLAVLASIVKSLGSLIIALALTEGHISGIEAITLSQLEESYETAHWGEDEEKNAKLQKLKSEIMAAEQFLSLLNS
jgi:chaperone required for assembly of F1-ATPase